MVTRGSARPLVGSSARTVTPGPPASTESRPPTERARSRMPMMPLPSVSAPTGEPSSATVTSRVSSGFCRVTTAVAVSVCRTMLVSDSCTMRKAAVSTAAGTACERSSRSDHLAARGAERSDEIGEPLESGARGQPEIRIAEDLQSAAQLVERLLARLLDRGQRIGNLLWPAIQDVQGDPGLKIDHRQAVSDHVVHLAGHAQPLLEGVRAAAPPPAPPGRPHDGCGGAVRPGRRA